MPPSLTPRALEITRDLDLTKPGLEIGPSYNPLTPKSLGLDVQIVDHATRDELLSKYRAWGHDDTLLDRIEEVDHIWQGGSLVDVVGAPARFGWILGAHVLEHTVDFLGFLQDCSQLLADDGRAAFAIPDMRQTFDLLAPLTTIGMVVDRHLVTDLPFHSPGAVLDAYAHQVRMDGQLAWNRPSGGELSLTHPDWAPTLEAFARAKEQREYVDIHRWVFTPVSFQLLMQELFEVGMTDLRISLPIVEAGHEFYVTLGRGEPEPDADRLALYRELLASQSRALTTAIGAATSDRVLDRVHTRARRVTSRVRRVVRSQRLR